MVWLTAPRIWRCRSRPAEVSWRRGWLSGVGVSSWSATSWPLDCRAATGIDLQGAGHQCDELVAVDPRAVAGGQAQRDPVVVALARAGQDAVQEGPERAFGPAEDLGIEGCGGHSRSLRVRR